MDYIRDISGVFSVYSEIVHITLGCDIKELVSGERYKIVVDVYYHLGNNIQKQ